MQILSVPIIKPDDVNVIVGQAHFIKTAEDIYEVIVATVPTIKFGIAFCEASGACKVRLEGNDEQLKELAGQAALDVACGHVFVVMIRNGFPINILNPIKNIAEVCAIFAATANPLEIIVGDTGVGRGVLGVIDGLKPKGIENQTDFTWRKDFLRQIGYKK